MKTITIKKKLHKGENRLVLFFVYDKELISLVKQVGDSRWSSSMNCWHVPDREGMLDELFGLFKGKVFLDYSDLKASTGGEPLLKEVPPVDLPPLSQKPQQPAQSHTNLETFGQDFEYSSPSSGMKVGPHPRMKSYGPVEFKISETEDKLVIRFTGRYDQEWIKEIKSFGNALFDPTHLEWVLSWSRMKVDSLSDYFASRGVEVIVRKVEVALPVKEQRDEQCNLIRERELGSKAMAGMEKVRHYLVERRYSRNTVESYLSLLELFFKYYPNQEPDDISEENISDFFHDFILYHKYSASYHNQLISAIKMYYRLNYSVNIDSSSLGRPRRGRTLPKVFSKDEVKKILNSTRNIKHRLILWMIYACGLRRSEVTNIRLKDLDRSREILNIREAKGMKDRIVPVPEKVWEKLDEYIDSYHPVFWLFEGQTGGRYSSESVYRVFKQALSNAGIKKDVGVHCLRHSYATHLHENGVDIRYIQELLGHKSSRTTEIYTHISRRNIVAVRSPIDDIELK